MKKTKIEKGITLIALIITVVVLMILATVAIRSMQNDGIIAHAENSTKEYNQAQENEQEMIDKYIDYLNKEEGKISADTIANAEDKTQYYGKTVNYTCGDTTVGWKIFYAGVTPGGTENNIYLIADSYIAWDDMGTTLQEMLYKNDTYDITFNNVSNYKDYIKGTSSNRFINSPAKNWLKYARSTSVDNGYGLTSNGAGMQHTAMMLDTVAWKNYCNTTYASYAIGGATLDMFVASWNQTQDELLYYDAGSSDKGYKVSNSESGGFSSNQLLSESTATGNLYFFDFDNTEKLNSVYCLASPAAAFGGSAQYLVGADKWLEPAGVSSAFEDVLIGLRPVISLYSDIQLTVDSSGEYDYKLNNLCEHEFANGKCTLCGRNCVHSYNQDGICEICSIECIHSYSVGECTICEKQCEHNYVDSICTICGEIDCTHSWTDGVCTLCGTSCEHVWSSGTCTICEYVCTHPEKDGDTCTVCGNTTCIAEGTLITLASGEQVAVENLTGEETLLVWNMITGRYEEADIAYIISHNDVLAERKIIHLYFSDGTDIEIISDHGFYDLDLNKIVYINEMNYEEYIGDYFVTQKLNYEKEWNKAQLTEVEIEYRTTRVYEVVTYEHLTCFTNGLLSISSLLNPFCNIFEVNPNTLSYDEELMAKDIEKYGLFTYDDFKDLIPEYAFNLYNVDYLKVALGKGLTTWDEINFLVQYYHKEIAPLIKNN